MSKKYIFSYTAHLNPIVMIGGSMKVQAKIGLVPNLKYFFIIVISIFITLGGCSETKDLTTDELIFGSDDELTDPEQTTGSLLTGCYWKRLGGYEKNTIKCRFDGPQGRP